MKPIKSKPLKIALYTLFFALVAAGTLLSMRWVISLREPENLAMFQDFVSSLGVGGGLLLLLIQYVQIVIAFIPGGPIQLVAGALFGPFWGMVICLSGMLLATATVFYLVERFGHRVIRLFIKEKEMKDYKFLSDANRLESLVFILFLIPGAPKDVLTYLFALTPIRLPRFLLLSTVARIPAALTSVLAGDSVATGDWLRAVIYFVVIAVISVGGLILHRKVMAFYHKKKGGEAKG